MISGWMCGCVKTESPPPGALSPGVASSFAREIPRLLVRYPRGFVLTRTPPAPLRQLKGVYGTPAPFVDRRQNSELFDPSKEACNTGFEASNKHSPTDAPRKLNQRASHVLNAHAKRLYVRRDKDAVHPCLPGCSSSGRGQRKKVMPSWFRNEDSRQRSLPRLCSYKCGECCTLPRKLKDLFKYRIAVSLQVKHLETRQDCEKDRHRHFTRWLSIRARTTPSQNRALV